MRTKTGRSNSNERGSAANRRARRAWLLSAVSGFGGDGEKVACWECGTMVDTRTLIVDRIVPGELGGRYTRDNIRPHCPTCSCRQGAARTWELRRLADPYDEHDNCRTCGAYFLATHVEGCANPEQTG